ncbi:limonene-1,2-epoxide hydrolase [Methylobacterium sp. Leaf86]|jgi:limonene-1,2-epoxide hydrolase|uniref:limonene-1,2-epoxide hydrolase family protein n=1 Tax=Methylobacterium sp. Leaf86 TaxID=1736242 RepID=UPI0006F9D12A|nr:limonene-1,2-epoxide hydrolase family protein [Methylobacterium sp. Leaf86]KQO52246.1 limonene-1,2-epoxide hydrolase [Methylobacterium sp. Leaf86]
MTEDTPEIALVRLFFERISADRFDDAIDLLSEEVFYHNIPLPEIRGRENARSFHKTLGVGSRIRVDWQLLRIAQDGDTVLTERLDLFTAGNGNRITLPTMGSMRVIDGVITEWRDYFDLASFERQAAALDA